MKRKFKRSFVLLEILIAFALVSTTILPFLRFPYQHMRQEIDLLFEMELEQLAQRELAKLHMALYEGKIDLESPLEPKKIEVTLSKDMKRIYTLETKIKREKQKKDEKTLHALVSIELNYLYPKRKSSLKAVTEVICHHEASS